MAVSATPAPLPLWKRVFFSLLLLTLIAAALELGASALLRITRGYDGEHLLQYSYDPYKSILPTPGYRDTRGVTHNSVGFRRRDEVSVAKPSGTLRVFLMGASTAFGTGGLWPHIQSEYQVLHDSVTIDRFLERLLAERYPEHKVEVINAAIASTWTHHSHIYLSQTILRYQPDLVLFLDGFNDFFQCDPRHDQFASYAYGERASVIMGEPTLKALAYSGIWWIARKSAFAHLSYRTLQSAGEVLNRRPRERQPIDVDRCLNQLKVNFPGNALAMWRRSAVILRSEGVESLFMLQPMLILDGGRPGLTQVERELYDFNVRSWLPGHDEYMRRATPWVSDTAKRTLSRVDAQFLDLTGIFANATEQVFTDYAHLTPRGNELLADVVAEAMIPLIEARLVARGPAAARQK